MNFANLTKELSDYKTSKFVILPVPYEKTTSYLKGTKNGPKAILEASQNLELYDEETDTIPAEKGIATLNPIKVGLPEKTIESIKKTCLNVLNDSKFPVIVGGEHTISLGFFLALKEKHKNISVLQLDAHADLRDTFDGSKLNHACVMRRIREHADAVQAGIRSMDYEEAEMIKYKKWKVFFARDMMKKDCSKEIIKNLKHEKVFITIDADVFDPGIMPSVGTPEPGGLDWYQMLEIIKSVAKEKEIVGFDFVEFCPNRHNKAPDFTAAKFIYKIIGYISKFSNLKKNC